MASVSVTGGIDDARLDPEEDWELVSEGMELEGV